jgi:D-beta-D-heptose 7-phosphate kinase/D-beta-D-heptose 1-phosphate adenosyltransferase
VIDGVSGRTLTWDEAARERERLREAGTALAFTNGVFDLLHPGHVELLERARAMAGALFVGLNTDVSVRRLKGPSRPFVPEADRARVLGALRAVDAVVLFDEDTPEALIRKLSPDVLVKGADYELGAIVGRESVEAAGGRVERVRLVEGRSTTDLAREIARRVGGSGSEGSTWPS